MKKLLFAAVALTAAAAMAAKDKIATLQLAPMDKLVQTVGKLAEMSGNASLGMMAAASLPTSPATNFCGSSRVVVTGDKDKKELAEMFDTEYEKGVAVLPDGVFARFTLAEASRAYIEKMLDTAVAEKDITRAEADEAVAYLKGFSGGVLDIAVSDAGVSLLADMKFADGSKMLGFRRCSLDSKPLSPISGAPLAAGATSGKYGLEPVEMFNRILAILAKHGVAGFDGVKASMEGCVNRFDIDAKRIVAWCKDEKNKAAIAKVDGDKIEKDFESLKSEACTGFKHGEGRTFLAVYMAGAKGGESASAALARILPESSSVKKCFGAFIVKYYSLLKTVFAAVAGDATVDSDGLLKQILPTLPSDAGSGVAGIYWMEGGSVKMLVRFSAGEIKGIGTSIAGFSAAFAMKAAAATIEEDEEDDDD